MQQCVSSYKARNPNYEVVYLLVHAKGIGMGHEEDRGWWSARWAHEQLETSTVTLLVGAVQPGGSDDAAVLRWCLVGSPSTETGGSDILKSAALKLLTANRDH